MPNRCYPLALFRYVPFHLVVFGSNFCSICTQTLFRISEFFVLKSKLLKPLHHVLRLDIDQKKCVLIFQFVRSLIRLKLNKHIDGTKSSHFKFIAHLTIFFSTSVDPHFRFSLSLSFDYPKFIYFPWHWNVFKWTGKGYFFFLLWMHKWKQ